MKDDLTPPTAPAVSSTLLDDVLACADSLRDLLDTACPPASFQREDADLVVDFVTEAIEHLDAAEQELLDSTNASLDTIFRAFHTIKGAAGFLQLHAVLTLAHATETLLDRLRRANHGLSDEATELVLGSVDHMRALVADVRTALDGRAVPPRAGVMEHVQRCNAFTPTPADTTPSERRAADRRSPGDGTIRIDVARLDALSALVEKLAAQALPDKQLGGIIIAIQAQCATLRTVRFDTVLRRLQRVAHDTARKVGKEVAFTLEGGDALLDRRVADALVDPLVHLLRNAIDHGIESSGRRAALGKPHAGKVELELYRLGTCVCVEVRDDGNGLDVQHLKDKAVQRGLITQADANVMSDRAAFELVFSPGLTTAATVSEISGRGVGMDVVRRNVHALGGQINVRSQAGGGAVFTLRIDTASPV